MNIIKIFEKFPTQKSCIDFLEEKRWNSKPICPYCSSDNICKNSEKKLFRHNCYNCHKSFSVTVNTIFHHTHLPLQKWFLAVSLMLSAKKGISALQLSRDIDVNKNTAWRISMQIRKAMCFANQKHLLQGIVEMDETYVGGKSKKNKGMKIKRGRGTNKVPVVGAIERDGNVVAKAITDGTKMDGKNLKKFVKEVIDVENTHLITDEYGAYIRMHEIIPHTIIRHKDGFADGPIHTNSIESFWALLKRGVIGQFHSISKKHMQKYVDEFCYRHNLRNEKKEDTFNNTLDLALALEI